MVGESLPALQGGKETGSEGQVSKVRSIVLQHHALYGTCRLISMIAFRLQSSFSSIYSLRNPTRMDAVQKVAYLG